MDHQVYFQCAEMSVWEAMDVPLGVLHGAASVDGIRKARQFTYERHFQPLRKSYDLDSSINSYFPTELSYPEDAVRAISGVFSHYNKVGQGEPTVVLSGLPLYCHGQVESQLGTTRDPSNEDLLSALAWFINYSPLLKRRELFPSWTWAGWQIVGGDVDRDGHWKAGYLTDRWQSWRARIFKPPIAQKAKWEFYPMKKLHK